MISILGTLPGTYIAQMEILVQILSEDRTAVSSCLPRAGEQASD